MKVARIWRYKTLKNCNMKNTFITPSRLAKLKQDFDNGQSATPTQIASAKRQNMTVEAYVNGINALKASLVRGKELR